MITSRYLGSPPAPLRTLYCPLEEFSRRASYSTGRLATTPETDADLTEESGSNGLCLERQAGLPEGHDPRAHGLTPYRVAFRRAESHPLRSMLDEGLWYRHPEREK